MSHKRTGIFYAKDASGVVIVLQAGREIARYDNVEAFISAHREGLDAVRDRQEELHRIIADQYLP